MFISIILFIYLLPIILTGSNSGYTVNNRLGSISHVDKINMYQNVFIMLWFIVAIVLAGFRGDFTADYNAYSNIFNKLSGIDISDFIYSYSTGSEYFGHIETGYRLINVLNGYVSQSPIFFFTLIAILTLAPILYITHKSYIPWMTILLYYTCGAYWASFNTVRSYLAASILIFSYKYLVSQRFIPYLIVVLIASTIHNTVLVTIPAYFILNIKPKARNIAIVLACSLCIWLQQENLAVIFNNLFSVAANQTELNLLLYRSHSKFISLLFPLLCCVTSLSLMVYYLKHKLINPRNNEIKILFNGTIIYSFLILMQVSSAYYSRIASFFYYFFILFVPAMVYRFPNVKLKKYLMTL